MTKFLNVGLCACMTLFTIATASAVPSVPLYISDTDGNIGTVDLSNGHVTVLGNAGTTLTDIGFTSDGSLYGTTFGTLYSISKTNGSAVPVYNFPATGIGSINALVGGGPSLLYAASNDTDTLYAINTSPFAIMPLTGSTGGAASGDLAFAPSGGSLYEAMASGDLVKLIYSDNTVSSTVIGNTGLFDVFGLATGDDGITYAVSGTEIYTVNLSTASLTPFLDYSGHGLGIAYGLAFSNEAGTTATPPAITSFTPVSGPTGTTVTITGSGFTGATSVKFNGFVATSFTVVSTSSITATVPAGATNGLIKITTPSGTATSVKNFTVTPSPPVIASFTPVSARVGSLITITGTGFTGAKFVKFHGLAASFTVVSASKITATVPTGATSGTIAITTPIGTATSDASFTVVPSPPVITTLSPSSAKIGTLITIAGTNFTGATSVRFNSLQAAFTVLAPTKITVTVPSGATNGPIIVITSAGSTVSPGDFTIVLSPPTIGNFFPTTGKAGTSVTVAGSNFANLSAVTLNGVAATNVVLLNASKFTFTVPAGASTGKISATTPVGSVISISSFTVK